jgi:hypothetical protein
MQGTITLPVNIQDECGVIVGKIRHDNFNHPVSVSVFKNTIGDFEVEITDQGEYRLVSDGLFPPDRTWLAKPSATGNKNVNAHATDSESSVIEFNIEEGEDLNGYIDFRIEVYPPQ